MSKEDQINLGEGNYEASFRILKKTGEWATLGTVRFETFSQLLVAMTATVECETERLASKIKEIRERQSERREILRALSGDDDSDEEGN